MGRAAAKKPQASPQLELERSRTFGAESRRRVGISWLVPGHRQCAIGNLVNRQASLADIVRRGATSYRKDTLPRRGIFAQRESALIPIVWICPATLQVVAGNREHSGVLAATHFHASPGPLNGVEI